MLDQLFGSDVESDCISFQISGCILFFCVVNLTFHTFPPNTKLFLALVFLSRSRLVPFGCLEYFFTIVSLICI